MIYINRIFRFPMISELRIYIGSFSINFLQDLSLNTDHQLILILLIYMVINAQFYFQVVSKQRMSELVREIDPTEQLDEDVEELLMTIADDFIESTVNAACKLAKHRGSRTLDVKDVQMYLGKYYIPI